MASNKRYVIASTKDDLINRCIYTLSNLKLFLLYVASTNKPWAQREENSYLNVRDYILAEKVDEIYCLRICLDGALPAHGSSHYFGNLEN